MVTFDSYNQAKIEFVDSPIFTDGDKFYAPQNQDDANYTRDKTLNGEFKQCYEQQYCKSVWDVINDGGKISCGDVVTNYCRLVVIDESVIEVFNKKSMPNAYYYVLKCDNEKAVEI